MSRFVPPFPSLRFAHFWKLIFSIFLKFKPLSSETHIFEGSFFPLGLLAGPGVLLASRCRCLIFDRRRRKWWASASYRLGETPIQNHKCDLWTTLGLPISKNDSVVLRDARFNIKVMTVTHLEPPLWGFGAWFWTTPSQSVLLGLISSQRNSNSASQVRPVGHSGPSDLKNRLRCPAWRSVYLTIL